ncbi:MAG: sulfatase-like hydrolase/transferase, partial [Lentisphaerae bacterium]|nr:sulfatase-like hydrolase/transferase [Lentisphaerota bacterium]
QLRAFETGCYGNPLIRTPNVDRLAGEGLRFETAVTNYPLCMPARSVLLSGQYNRTCTNGTGNVVYRSEQGRRSYMPEYPEPGRTHLPATTLPELLHEAGYHTRAIGKWHINVWPHRIGFDDYVIPRVHHAHTGQLYTENGGPEFAAPGYSVDFEAERVESFLDSRRTAGQPFFLYYNISVPHCPLADAPEQYRAMYAPEDVPLRANVDPERPIENQDFRFKVYRYDYRYYDLRLPYTETLPEGYALRNVIAEYYGMTTWMDAALGRMLAALDRTGLADDTLVVFTSDHGDNLGSHGLCQKGSMNEEAIRIPLIVRGPARQRDAGVDKKHVVSLVDMAPTLLSRAGLPIPDHMQGRDLTPCLQDGQADVASCAFVENQQGAAIRSARHLYFLPYAAGSRQLAGRPEQFFDLGADPWQQSNLAATARDSDIAGELDSQLRQWDHQTPWMG